MYQDLRSSNRFSYQIINDKFDEHQAVWPRAIWNEDMFIKYITPLINPDANVGSDQETVQEWLSMLQGSKESQRDWWLFNAFRYRDSKYQTGDAKGQYVTLRGYDLPASMSAELKALYSNSIEITPYSNIYAWIKYGSINVTERAYKGVPITLQSPVSHLNDTEIYIYSADRISEIGDLSGLNVGLAQFDMATKLQKIKLGDDTEGYRNENLKSLSIGGNELLLELDITNCVNFGTDNQKSINVTQCHSLETVKAKGTQLRSLDLAPGAKIKRLYLPTTMTSLHLVNQTHFELLDMDSYENIETLHIENTPNVPFEDIIESAPNLHAIKAVGVDWTATDETSLMNTIEALKDMNGYDSVTNTSIQKTGDQIVAVVTGRVRVDSISAANLNAINTYFPQLIVVVNNVPQIYVQFLNWDNSFIYATVVNEGGDVYTPSIPDPTKFVQEDADNGIYYAFAGWGTLPTNVVEPLTIHAQYDVGYRVRFYAYFNGPVLQESVIMAGNNVVYDTRTNGTPEKAMNAQYTFSWNNGWDHTLVNVQSSFDTIATYTSTIRQYTVQFVGENNVVLETQTANYGATIQYGHGTPTSITEGLSFNTWMITTGEGTVASNGSITIRGINGVSNVMVITAKWLDLRSVVRRLIQHQGDNLAIVDTITTTLRHPIIECPNLTSIDFENATSIVGAGLSGNRALLYGCQNITHVGIPLVTTTVNMGVVYTTKQIYQLENNTSNRPAITLDARNLVSSTRSQESQNYSSFPVVWGGVYESLELNSFERGQIAAYCYIGNLYIPNYTSSDSGILQGITGLTSLSLPNFNFRGNNGDEYSIAIKCPDLVSISAPNITRIGHDGFCQCTSLTNIYLPSLTTATLSAFSGCTSIDTVEFPNVVAFYRDLSSSGAYMYYGVSSLRNLILSANQRVAFRNIDCSDPNSLNLSWYLYFDQNFKIFVPDNLLSDYQIACPGLLDHLYPISQFSE